MSGERLGVDEEAAQWKAGKKPKDMFETSRFEEAVVDEKQREVSRTRETRMNIGEWAEKLIKLVDQEDSKASVGEAHYMSILMDGLQSAYESYKKSMPDVEEELKKIRKDVRDNLKKS